MFLLSVCPLSHYCSGRFFMNAITQLTMNDGMKWIKRIEQHQRQLNICRLKNWRGFFFVRAASSSLSLYYIYCAGNEWKIPIIIINQQTDFFFWNTLSSLGLKCNRRLFFSGDFVLSFACINVISPVFLARLFANNNKIVDAFFLCFV